MATIEAPENEIPPFCLCGCGIETNWMPGKGWAKYQKGHYSRGKPGTRLGAVLSVETKQKMSRAIKQYHFGRRRRDTEDKPGLGVYATAEYKKARELLVVGNPCSVCGSVKNVSAHHEKPGDDSSLVPVCRKCHPTIHAAPGAKGRKPYPGQQPPFCECGCGLPVAWKRVRGWAKYRKGHAGATKVSAGTKLQEAPLCKCGCGEKTKFHFGKGWNKYKRGHSQRVEGHYKHKKDGSLKCQSSALKTPALSVSPPG